MEKKLVIIMLAVFAFSISPIPVEAAEVVIEMESLELSNAEVRELESASGKVVAFVVESAEAKGEVELDRGVYMVSIYMFAPDGEQDAVYVAVGDKQERVFPTMHATITESVSFTLNILEKKKYPISITCVETGVLLDRLVIQPAPAQAVSEPVEDVASPAVAIPMDLTNVEPGPTDGRPRVVVTSDGEIDDQASMIRFLLYANECDVEAIVLSSSQYHSESHGHWAGNHWVDPDLDAYEQVYPNLLKHDPRYPTPDYLRARTAVGNVKVEGDMAEPTAGSNLIVKVLLDKTDNRPVWMQAWGGMNTISRALKTIEEEHPERMAEVAAKCRLFFIWEQDATYQEYIRPHWGKYNIPTIVSDQFEAVAYRWKQIQPKEMQVYFDAAWMKENILENHGPLCSIYAAHNKTRERNGFEYYAGDFQSEGDSPAFFHNIVTGLRNMESPDWGGWGGRYVRVYENTWLDPVPVEGYTHPEGRWYTKNAWGRQGTRERKTSAANPDYREYFRQMWRWTPALQNDFAARADWCVKSYENANHPPVVKLNHSVDLKAKPGETVKLSAKGTIDPDGDTLNYRWWQYTEADTYQGTVEIKGSAKKNASFKVPSDASSAKTIHIVCEVTDDGTPPLTRYQRVVVEIE